MRIGRKALRMARKNVELEQAGMRLLLVVSGLVYTLFLAKTAKISGGLYNPVIILGWCYIAFSLLIILQTYLYPNTTQWRHTLYMSLDVLLVCALLYFLGENGVPFFAVYLWLTVGNGFRYGYKELILCALLSLSGFVFVIHVTAFWRDEFLFAVTGIILLSIIPLYVSIMLKRLQTEKKRAEIASKEKSRFLANVSHEIRTPLNAVMGFCSLLGKVKEKSEQDRILVHINDASESLMSLVGGVLDFSRIEAGHVQIRSEKFDLYNTIYSTASMLSVQAEGKGVRFITELDVGVPPIIMGDAVRLRQVLVNLLGNAIKFTNKGEIRLKVGKEHSGFTGDRIVFEVIDTGIGISKEMQACIFERFRQADDTVQRKYGGTGLGTAIAKRLVELMGGNIGVESSEFHGSRFWFDVPLATVPAQVQGKRDSDCRSPAYCVITGADETGRGYVVDPHLQAVLAKASGVFSGWSAFEEAVLDMGEHCLLVDCHGLDAAAIQTIVQHAFSGGAFLIAYHTDQKTHELYLRLGFQLVLASLDNIGNALHYGACFLQAKMAGNSIEDYTQQLAQYGELRVLVADDCRMNRYVMKDMLIGVGVEPAIASSGGAALEMLCSNKYDVVLLDIQMPGLSGFDVIRRYRELRSEDQTAPIVVITGDATQDVYDECAQLGVSRFLLKPVDHRKLVHVICSLLSSGNTDTRTQAE